MSVFFCTDGETQRKKKEDLSTSALESARTTTSSVYSGYTSLMHVYLDPLTCERFSTPLAALAQAQLLAQLLRGRIAVKSLR